MNRRPAVYKTAALPAELLRRYLIVRLWLLSGFGTAFRRGLKAVDPLAEKWHHIVRIGIAAEHRFLEDELAVQVDVEDSAGSGHELDAFELLLPLLENPRRQTGGVRERPSGNAVLDPDVVPVRHEDILADSATQPGRCASQRSAASTSANGMNRRWPREPVLYA